MKTHVCISWNKWKDYIVTIEDVNGCTTSDTVGVSWDLFTLDFDQINTTDVVPCYGNSTGSISVSVDNSTGFSPYTYSTPVNDSVSSTVYISVQIQQLIFHGWKLYFSITR